MQPSAPTTSTNQKFTPRIAVVAVGGAGGNAVDNMIHANMQGVEFVVCNTDAQALQASLADHKIQLGASVTSGLGAGAKPEVGRMAAEETLDDIMSLLEGTNMVFVTAGMGGGTGTGAAPVVARACRERDILTVGVVTKPFHFEGSTRMRMAEEGIKELQEYVDTLIVIPNQNLFRIANERTTFAEAFKMADSVLQSGVRGVTDLIVNPGLINLDFADIRSIMLEMGKAVMGTGEATGEKRAIEAAEKAISNPLLDDMSMKGAKGVIINVTGGPDMTLFEADEACNRIRDEIDPDANIIFGTSFDDNLEGSMRVSIVATGIDKEVAAKGGQNGGYILGERAAPRTVGTSAPVAGGTPGRVFTQQQQQPLVQRAVQQPQQQQVQTQPVQHSQTQTFAQMSQGAQTHGHVEADLFGQNATQMVVEAPVTHGETLRGSTYGDAFIPPVAATPEQYGGSYTQSYTNQSVNGPSQPQQPQQQYQQQPQTQGNAALKLNPPVPGAHKPKKAPSLFERITGGAWRGDQQEESFRSDETETTGGTQGGGDTFGATPAPRAAQPRLSMDAPAAKPSIEDELDIPAFLRRQAN
ncbi:MAG: cell division protein FtsZ [Pseudobdellovibrionaceae bacterium]